MFRTFLRSALMLGRMNGRGAIRRVPNSRNTGYGGWFVNCCGRGPTSLRKSFGVARFVTAMLSINLPLCRAGGSPGADDVRLLPGHRIPRPSLFRSSVP